MKYKFVFNFGASHESSPTCTVHSQTRLWRPSHNNIIVMFIVEKTQQLKIRLCYFQVQLCNLDMNCLIFWDAWATTATNMVEYEFSIISYGIR